MLTLFPFEADYYERHGVPVDFVGHPIADEIDPEIDKAAIRADLGMPGGGETVVAMLPGSRMIELQRLGDLFIQVARELRRRLPDIHLVAPFANAETRSYFESLLRGNPDVRVDLVDGRSRSVIAAADVALVASGTAALEAALLKIPVVVTYRGSWLSAKLVRMLAHVDHFSMPNHLLDVPLVPEYFQEAATVENLTEALMRYLSDEALSKTVSESFGTIISTLRRGASERAADVIAGMLR